MSFPLQQDLFISDQQQLDALPDVDYRAALVAEPDRWFIRLQSSLDWNPRYQSRLTASFGATRITNEPVNPPAQVTPDTSQPERRKRPLPDFILPLRDIAANAFGFKPDSCLVNYYPDGDHYISFHSDDDNDLAANTGVAILSLGSVREMVLRRSDDHRNRVYYPLQPGSGFFMSDASQKQWQHGIPRQRGCGPRISLSFRQTAGD